MPLSTIAQPVHVSCFALGGCDVLPVSNSQMKPDYFLTSSFYPLRSFTGVAEIHRLSELLDLERLEIMLDLS